MAGQLVVLHFYFPAQKSAQKKQQKKKTKFKVSTIITICDSRTIKEICIHNEYKISIRKTLFNCFPFLGKGREKSKILFQFF